MTPSVRHIVILPHIIVILCCPLLSNGGKIRVRSDIVFKEIICIFRTAVIFQRGRHYIFTQTVFCIRRKQKMEPKRMFQPFALFITAVLVVLTEAQSLYFSPPCLSQMNSVAFNGCSTLAFQIRPISCFTCNGQYCSDLGRIMG